MITEIIHWSIRNRVLVLLVTAMLLVYGAYSIRNTPVDAIPDLSDVQVIIKTSYPGQAPQVVQDQVTYPLSTAMLAVPGAQTVRGYSFFGDSFVYVIFDDDTDIYWARSRVLEYLNQVAAQLPATASPQLGPDATGVGWVYLYALTDPSGQHDLHELRSYQDWFLKYELQSVPGVSEVATLGGMVKQYQVVVNPEKLKAYDMPLAHIKNAIAQSNQEVGASVIEMAEAEYMVRTNGYLQNINDLKNIPLGLSLQQTPLLLSDVAEIRLGPAARRGLADINGQGEATVGIVVMRYGEHAQKTINAVKDKLEDLKKGLPEGIELTTVYDRSDLIERSVTNLWDKLWQEFLVVSLVCVAFLFHLRSSLVAIISLPVAIVMALIVMHWQGLNANIMSLGGIAIAIGAMIDGAIVMVENMHKNKENPALKDLTQWQLTARSATEVGPALFFSLLIITVSFLPIFALEAQEGRLFTPLAYTKTFAMAAAAILAITLVPVLMGLFIKGRIRAEQHNPLGRWLINVYRPVLQWVLQFPKSVVMLFLVLTLSAWWPLQQLGSEFMPDLDEGDLMYMPTTDPGISIGKARELLQQTDKLIASRPEVELVMGKMGRAETATDPAPLTMMESYIKLKPRDQWREGMTTQDLIDELNQLIRIPGLTNAWVMPIKTRIDMLATGIKTPVGVKISGPDLDTLQQLGSQVEQLLGELPGTASVYAEKVAGGRYIKIDINRLQASSLGLNIQQLQELVAHAVGGRVITYTVEDNERHPINLRFPQSYRNSPEQLRELPVITPAGAHITLGQVADIHIESGPPAIKSENGRVNAWVYIDIRDTDVGSYVRQAQKQISEHLALPPGYAIKWAGQYEYLQRAQQKMNLVVPLTLGLIVVLLYLNFKRWHEVWLIMLTLPFALVGSTWLLYWLDHQWSVAVGVGMIALAGVAVETCVIMLLYLNQAIADGSIRDKTQLTQRIIAGACGRIRPVMMTAIATILGLIPIMSGSGTGSEVMSRLAAPMVGGMVSTLILTMFLVPVLFSLWHGRALNTEHQGATELK
ncbi:efflux RND transporter permease subunit [Marinicella sediminis]|uniref:Efflux RND transporter permease subunit n=1 Tax=Marinicella sediminis TaxID=1792834 RepID=A0ABV7J8N3_9GAMM|nr:CusA/CzcA family heavy metal efflux RND transporter [Marinicella sediminis]